MIHETTENEQHGCLQLVNPTHIHNGVYKLVTENRYGRDEKNISAQFLDPPNINHPGQCLFTEACLLKPAHLLID